MAVLMRTQVQGAASEQVVPFISSTTAEMRAFPGFVLQASGPVPGGFQVTEVWETQEAHERWVREVIAPRAQRLGLPQLGPVEYSTLDLFITR